MTLCHGMRLALAVLLVPTFAAAGGHRTTISVRVDDDNKALNAAFMKALRTKTGSKLDACWKQPAHASAKVTFEAGKVSAVELTENGDPAAEACITKVLRGVRLDPKATVAVVELDGVAKPVSIMKDGNKKLLDRIIDTNMSTSLSKFHGIRGSGGSGLGTGVGEGTGTGTAHGKGTGGGGTVEGDFVSKGSVATGTDAKVAIGPIPPPDGALTADEINRVMKSRAGVFRACYEKELSKEPKLAGKVVVNFKIGADGKVVSAAVASSTLSSRTVGDCIARNVLRLAFPPSTGPSTVNYPFLFSNAG